MKNLFIIFLSFFSLFSSIDYLKAAEKVNIKFEEMKIPLTIDQLSKLESYNNNSTELIDWLKKNGFMKVFEFSKFLKFPVFKDEGLNRQVLRSWIGRRILSELSKTIVVPNDKNGIKVFNTIEILLEDKREVSILDILKALPSEEILLDIDNLILIISYWKNELVMQQNLISKLNALEIKSSDIFQKTRVGLNFETMKINREIFTPHRFKNLEIELWKNNEMSAEKELIIFMPGLGGDINNFKWLGEKLTERGWPIIFLDHEGSNSQSITEVLKGNEVLPDSVDFYMNRIKDLDAVVKAHINGEFDLGNKSYILMGHSLGALIALLYENNNPINGLDNRCTKSLKDFAVTNLSKLLQCQLSEIPLPERKNPNNASAIIGFNTFGSLIWPKDKSSKIESPILLIGGTYDLITPLISEQFKVFLSSNNPLNRFLIIEGASHFSPIRINNLHKDNKDVFKIKEPFIGSNPISVQDLSLKIIIEFISRIKNKDSLQIISNERDLELEYHILDRKTLIEISRD